MILFNTEQLDQLYEQSRLGNQGKDWFPVAKLLLPGTGCCWLLTEIRPHGEQFGYGLSDFGLGIIDPGYINLAGLSGIADPWDRHRVRLDHTFKVEHPISVSAATRMFGYITENECKFAQGMAF